MASTAAPEEGLYSSEEEGLDSEQRELYYNMASESEVRQCLPLHGVPVTSLHPALGFIANVFCVYASFA